MRSRAFTLVEVLIVIIVLAILATVMVSKVSNPGLRAKEASLRANLRLIREAGARCEADTGLTVDLTDLIRATPPATGWERRRMNTNWPSRALKPSTWRGPYLDVVPVNPILGTNHYVTGGGNPTAAWTHYSNQGFNPSYYYFPSTLRASDGTQYRTW